ncbi:MAG: DNA-binding protein [Spongiibacteraceae bacterium]
MARGGINKAHVLQARETLMARGVNPSIDAIRTEMGNTGSKSTIHRYLREIEQEHGTRLDDEALLSNTLKELVSRLAAQLREEAGALVTEAQQHHDAQRVQWVEQEKALQSSLQAARVQLDTTAAALAVANTERDQHRESWQQEKLESQRLRQHVADLQDRLAENEKHRQSLEEKHQHAREALEHYRESVKEQRDQEQRRHEQQLQHIQTELRQLQQTLIVKQNDITQLNKDNARLVSELGSLNKQFSGLRVDYQAAQDAVMSWRDKSLQQETQLQAAQQQQGELLHALNEIKQQLQAQLDKNQQSAVALVKAEMQLLAQDEVLQTLRAPLATEA